MNEDLIFSINEILKTLDSIENPINTYLNPENRRSTMGALKDIQDKIKISKTNNTAILDELFRKETLLKKLIEKQSDTEIKLLELIDKLDNFICNQQVHLSPLDLEYKVSPIDRSHHFRLKCNFSKSHKLLREHFQSLSLQDKVLLINVTCKLSGLKKLYVLDDLIKSASRPNIDEILKAVMDKEGFWLIKSILTKHALSDNLIAPLDLLKEIISYYNKKGRSITKSK